MIPVTPESHDLDEIYELNRLFLGFLRERARQRVDCLDLAPPTARLLGSVGTPMLESAAQVPRALFRLRLEAPTDWETGRGPRADAPERAAHALQLTLLHSTWNLSRRSGYKARLFLGVSLGQLRRLRVTPLSNLPAIAGRPGLVGCAFSGAQWLWRGLLTETRPEHKRQLLLMVLQPQVTYAPIAGRPSRREAIS